MTFKKIIAREFLITVFTGLILFSIYCYCTISNQVKEKAFVKIKGLTLDSLQSKKDSLSLLLESMKSEQQKEANLLDRTGLTYDQLIALYLNVPNAKKLYDEASLKFLIGDYDTYLSSMATFDGRKKFFDTVSKKVDIGDYKTYESNLNNGHISALLRTYLFQDEIVDVEIKDIAAFHEECPEAMEINFSKIENLKRNLFSRRMLQKEISQLDFKIQNGQPNLHSETEIKKLLLSSLWVSIILLFILRYMFYAIVWSIKTLKKPEPNN